jgi:DNA-binding beta-propeller fold protein YncE
MRTPLVFGVVLLLAGSATAADPKPYTLVKTVPVPGGTGWDYVTVDDIGRRVYLSHGTQVDVLDADTGEWKGKVEDTPGVHGIAIAADLGKGFTSNGRANAVTIFDTKTLKPLGSAKTGANPDAIIYDPSTKRVFAINHTGKSVTAIEAKDGSVAGTVDVGGVLEFAAADGAGNVFVNLEDKNTVVRIDAKALKVLDTWPLAPAATPTGLAIDPKTHRLFVGCRSKHLVVMDSQSGKIVTTQPIGTGTDATAFDPETGNIFCSCGDGTVSVYREDGGKYVLVETIKTKAGAKTMGLDLKTHKLFIPAVDRAAPGPTGRPGAPVPNSFAVMIFGN